MRIVLAVTCICGVLLTNAQVDSSFRFTASGYVDAYLTYDTRNPGVLGRPWFLYNHNRHNQLSINNAVLKLEASTSRYRGAVALHSGTYVQANYSNEPGILSVLYEGYAGVMLGNNGKTWVDAGIFGSHIGFESALSMDCWTLTRSLCAENSPYYESGIRIYHTPNERWQFGALVLNGWQQISRPDPQRPLSYGTQVKYTGANGGVLNWSTYFGDIGTSRSFRVFNNLYAQLPLGDKWGVIAGFDVGFSRSAPEDRNMWTSPVVILRRQLDDKWWVAARAEQYVDKGEIIISDADHSGFSTSGFSLNIDHAPAADVLCRIEGRWLESGEDIFYLDDDGRINSSFAITASLAVRFSRTPGGRK